MGVGMPEALRLQEFAHHVWHAFGEVPYHVGSSVEAKTWRDVDVRVLLPDEKWEQFGLGDPDNTHRNGRWVALTLAFSALGRQMTGLPIDFQLQQRTHANRVFTGLRSALVVVPRRVGCACG